MSRPVNDMAMFDRRRGLRRQFLGSVIASHHGDYAAAIKATDELVDALLAAEDREDAEFKERFKDYPK